MTLLDPNAPIGDPAFALNDDQVATVVDLACQGAYQARNEVSPGMYEVPITVIVRKAMRRVRASLGLTNLQIQGEVEIDDMTTADPAILGRIDITLQFLHQFGDEDAYVAIECKRVKSGDSSLNVSYVTDGVDRFATGQYAAGHSYGFMLGYALTLPIAPIIDVVKRRIRNDYGESADLEHEAPHPLSLGVLNGSIPQAGGHKINLKHIFVDMVPAN